MKNLLKGRGERGRGGERERGGKRERGRDRLLCARTELIIRIYNAS
jgi:hypothetical protein